MAQYGGDACEGKAMLETGFVLFRGNFRVRLPFLEMTSVEVVDGWLVLGTADGPLRLELGAAASKWADKILHPLSRLDKLGVKADSEVALVGTFDDVLRDELQAIGATVVSARLPCDVALYQCDSRAGLGKIPKLIPLLKPSSGLWIVYPKGIQRITEVDVIKAGRAAGLKDVKVASYSGTQTALKFVIPVAARK